MGTQVPAGAGLSVSKLHAGYYPVFFIYMSTETAARAKPCPDLKQEVDYKAWDREREEWEAERQKGERFDRWVYFFVAWLFILFVSNAIVIDVDALANPLVIGILFLVTGAAVWFGNRNSGIFS